MRHIFCLGNAPELATTELESVFKRQGVAPTLTSLLPSVISVETPGPLSVELFELLGGTVKVAQVLAELNPASDNAIINKITTILKNKISEEHQAKMKLPRLTPGVSSPHCFVGSEIPPKQKVLRIHPRTHVRSSLRRGIDFGLSFSSEKSISNFPDLNRWAKTIKNSLEEEGIKVRYVLPKPQEFELSSVVVAKQKLTEIQILTIKDKAILAKTIWVQSFEQWNRRDSSRPAIDPHAGMLPPKVARMMVNIALVAANAEKRTILDPFCGVGTILAEALMVGVNTIGSDINPAQIEKTKKNLEWLTKTYNFEPNRFHLYVCDAREISQKLSPNSVDAIVTEPDLGPNTNLAPEKRTKTTLWLERLYLDSLSDWKKILRPNGRVIMVLPSFQGGFGLVKNVVDKAKIMGYSLTTKPFPYFRPQAQVRRNICVFKLSLTTDY